MRSQLCTYLHVYDLTKYLGVNPISSIEETDITENSATLTCELPCFSPNVQCVLSQFISCTNVNVTIGNITGSVESYSYPTQTISVSGLNSNTTYKYCVALTNTTNMIMVGGPVCGSFTTQKIISEANDDSKYINYLYVHAHSFHSIK